MVELFNLKKKSAKRSFNIGSTPPKFLTLSENLFREFLRNVQLNYELIQSQIRNVEIHCAKSNQGSERDLTLITTQLSVSFDLKERERGRGERERERERERKTNK